MRFNITDRTLREALNRYDLSRRIRYGEDQGFDWSNPGHVSRLLGCAVENQISLMLHGKPSGHTDPSKSADAGFDLLVAGHRYDVKANNVENHNSWLIDSKEGKPNAAPKPEGLRYLFVNGTYGADYENNRTFEIMGWMTHDEVVEKVPIKWYRFGPYHRVTTELINPMNTIGCAGM